MSKSYLPFPLLASVTNVSYFFIHTNWPIPYTVYIKEHRNNTLQSCFPFVFFFSPIYTGQINATTKTQTIASQTSLSTFVKKAKTNREIRQLRMFRVIVLLMLSFFICRLPTWIYLIYKLNYAANTNLHWVLHYSFGFLSIFNCVLNPFLYTFLSNSIHCSSMCLDRLTMWFGCGGNGMRCRTLAGDDKHVK